MEDEKIIELYWLRDESAIKETQLKYGNYCYSIAYRILHSNEDASECENDTYLGAWNTMPPKRPNILQSYLGMLCRSRSLDKWRKLNANKRGDGEFVVSLNELEECIPDQKSIDDEIDEKELARIISAFLRSIPQAECDVFLYRYWYFASISEICEKFGFGQSKVKMMLMRTRRKLQSRLEEEGVFV